MAGSPEGRRADTDGRRVLARHAGEALRPGPDVGQAPRPDRLARTGRLLLRLWRRPGDGEGCARDAGPRVCRCEGVVAASRRGCGARSRSRAALPAGRLLTRTKINPNQST